MKIAILSDIHGNYDALDAVLKEIDFLNIKIILSLGDIVGYYYEPKRVFDALKNRNTIFIRGNHENYLLSCFKQLANDNLLENLTQKYGSGLNFALKQLDHRDINEIGQLPEVQDFEINGCKILMCHGSPSSTEEYIYPDSSTYLLNKCDIYGYDLVCLGHTHYPFIRRGNNTLIVNVGSIGQSRVVGGIANWGLWNSDNHTYIAKHTTYCVSSLCQEVIRNDPENKYMLNILRRNVGECIK